MYTESTPGLTPRIRDSLFLVSWVRGIVTGVGGRLGQRLEGRQRVVARQRLGRGAPPLIQRVGVTGAGVSSRNVKRGGALRWRTRTFNAGLILLDVDLAAREAARDQVDADLVAGDVSLPGPLGGDGAATEVDLDLEPSLAAVLLGHPGLVFEAGPIRKNLDWRRTLSGVLRTKSQIHCRTEWTSGVPEVGKAECVLLILMLIFTCLDRDHLTDHV